MPDTTSHSYEGAGLIPPLPSFWNDDLRSDLIAIARTAGALIMDIRAQSSLNTRHKADGSPVTAADAASQDAILAGLRQRLPDCPVVAEEKTNAPDLAQSPYCWLVDPLDGTRAFVAGDPSFTINIGLLADGVPCLGLLYAPALDDLFYGDADGAFRIKGGITSPLIPRTTTGDAPPDILTSQREARHLPIKMWQQERLVGRWDIFSSAYKLGLLAAGESVLYLRSGPTYEWDTAAGDAILRAVGGGIMTAPGRPMAYGKTDFKNGAFIAYGSAESIPLVPTYFDLMRAA